MGLSLRINALIKDVIFPRSYVSIIYAHAAVSKSLRQSSNNVTITIDLDICIK